MKAYVDAIAPELSERVERYEDPELPIFERFHIHEQLHKALDRKVWLPSGGSLIVERPAALTGGDVNTGKTVGNFASGRTPHESNFSADGKRIYHASIGTVYTPTDEYAFDATKGERIFEIVDAKTYEIIKRFDIGKILRTFGFPGMSSAWKWLRSARG